MLMLRITRRDAFVTNHDDGATERWWSERGPAAGRWAAVKLAIATAFDQPIVSSAEIAAWDAFVKQVELDDDDLVAGAVEPPSVGLGQIGTRARLWAQPHTAHVGSPAGRRLCNGRCEVLQIESPVVAAVM